MQAVELLRIRILRRGLQGVYRQNNGKKVSSFDKNISFWNQYGRSLLDAPGVPLGLWPLVLEKAVSEAFNHWQEPMISVVYEFLKGPAFAARQNMG